MTPVYQRALAARGTSVRAPADPFYGDRMGGVRDSNGKVGWIATHIEDISPEEVQKRAESMGQ